MEWPIVAALAGALGAATAVLGFWLNLSDRISRSDGRAKSAEVAAQEAKSSLAVLHGQFALHREMVAREYVNRDVMREVEDRLTGAVRETEVRLTAAIEKTGNRLDRMVEDRRSPQVRS